MLCIKGDLDMIVIVAEYDGWNENEILQNLGVLKES